jgi:hypothetical protein
MHAILEIFDGKCSAANDIENWNRNRNRHTAYRSNWVRWQYLF